MTAEAGRECPPGDFEMCIEEGHRIRVVVI